MKRLLLLMLVCTIFGFGLAGCGKKAGTEHPSGGHEHPSSEHPKTEHPK